MKGKPNKEDTESINKYVKLAPLTPEGGIRKKKKLKVNLKKRSKKII